VRDSAAATVKKKLVVRSFMLRASLHKLRDRAAEIGKGAP